MTNIKQESHAVAQKPRDAACYVYYERFHAISLDF